MSREYFPVIIEELPAELNFYDISELQNLNINGIKVKHTHLIHPAMALGFRLICDDKIFVYATDNEIIKDKNLSDYNEPNLKSLIENSDVLVSECQYTDQEYKSHVGWGHSGVESVVKLCNKYNVKRMYIFHHDPYHNDMDIDEIVKKGKHAASNKLKVYGAREGQSIIV
jgi:ribonuclease BN (tRNA processing enzyme)